MKERQVAGVPTELAKVQSKGRTVTGYASVFNYPIQAGHGMTHFVRPGAFTKTLDENPDQIQVLVNHGMSARYGQDPVATINDVHEDRHGLKVAYDIIDDPFFDPLVAQLKTRAFRGQSIQFETVKESFNDEHTERNIEELALWEFGPVTFPANAAATAELHSIVEFAKLAAAFDLAALDLAESLDDESRESTLDASRLTWSLRTGQLAERAMAELAEQEARLKALGG
jgi:HK97 family phage prohead protease